MKILMLSLDGNILVPGSKSARRMLAYGRYMEELHIIVHAPGAASSEPIVLSDSVRAYPTANSTRAGYFIRAYRLGISVIRARRFDPLRDRITAQDAFPTGLVGYLLRSRFRIPLQIQVHIDFFNPAFFRESFLQRVQYVFNRLLLPRADAIRAVSREIGAYCEHRLGIDPRRIDILPVTPDFPAIAAHESAYSLRMRYPQFRIIVLVAGRLVPQKNVMMAVRAMRRLAASDPDIGLVIAGAGLQEATLKAAAVGTPTIVFEPWADDIYSHYKTADIFLLPSRYEGWGLTALEAMAARLPVIMTLAGCAKEIVRDGKNAIIVPQSDDRALAHAIAHLARDDAFRLQMADAGRATVAALRPQTVEEYSRAVADGIRSASFHA